MVSSRKHWLRTLLAGMGIIAASVGASTASAQSIDPFRPYNSQYDAYRYPIGPATPEGGQSVPMALSGVRGANQYQNYLDQLQGRRARGNRTLWHWTALLSLGSRSSFRPQRQSRIPSEQQNRSHVRANSGDDHRKIFCVLYRKRPKKRAELLRSFNRARSQVTRHYQRAGTKPSDCSTLRAAVISIRDRPSRPAVGRIHCASPLNPSLRIFSAATPSLRSESDRADDALSPSIPPAPPLFPGLGTRGSRTRRQSLGYSQSVASNEYG